MKFLINLFLTTMLVINMSSCSHFQSKFDCSKCDSIKQCQLKCKSKIDCSSYKNQNKCPKCDKKTKCVKCKDGTKCSKCLKKKKCSQCTDGKKCVRCKKRHKQV